MLKHLEQQESAALQAAGESRPTIILGSDHAGFELKETVKQQLAAGGIPVEDCGHYSTDSTDYPDYAIRVGRKVAEGGASLENCHLRNRHRRQHCREQGSRSSGCSLHDRGNGPPGSRPQQCQCPLSGRACHWCRSRPCHRQHVPENPLRDGFPPRTSGFEDRVREYTARCHRSCHRAYRRRQRNGVSTKTSNSSQARISPAAR